jgi:hypothetical protein
MYYPGGYFARLIRYLFKGKKLYPKYNFDNKRFRYSKVLSEKKVGVGVDIDKDHANRKWGKVFKELSNKEGVWVYLHGSQADRTAVRFSDYDDLVIISADEFNTLEGRKSLVRSLCRVDMRLCKLDPLQHHGHWIIFREDLCDLDESYIPMMVLKKGLNISGPDSIKYTKNLLKTKLGLFKNIEKNLNTVRLLGKKMLRSNINIYNLKRLVGSILITPAYIYQLNGIQKDKKESIENARTIYSNDTLNIIKWASLVRDEWSTVLEKSGYKYFSPLSKCFYNPFLYRKFARKFSPTIDLSELHIREISEVNIKKFISESTIKAKNSIVLYV